MFRYKDRTAIFEWKNGCLIGINLLRNSYNILLIHCNEWTINRHLTNLICCSKGMHRLACNLSNTLTRDKSKTIAFVCKVLCNLHHITAHNNGKLIVWTFLIDCHLNICKINDIKFDLSRITCNLLCKVYNLLFCSFTCIWWCMEISRFNGNTTL